MVRLNQSAGLLMALALLIALFSFLGPGFFSLRTLASISNQIPDLTFLAVGMTLVLIAGGIDLSVGSVLALCSAVIGFAMVDVGLSLPMAIALAVIAGLACGLVSGSVTTFSGIPAFIVTLGMLEIARGLDAGNDSHQLLAFRLVRSLIFSRSTSMPTTRDTSLLSPMNRVCSPKR